LTKKRKVELQIQVGWWFWEFYLSVYNKGRKFSFQ